MTKTNVRACDLRAADSALTVTSEPAVSCVSKHPQPVSPKVLSIADRRGSKLITAPRASDRRDQILAETAHDLNNALSVVRLQLELLALDLLPQSGIGTEAVWHRLRLIEPAVVHATDILRDLMHPPASATGRGPARLRPIPLNPVVQRMVPILSAMLPPGVTLHLRLSPDLAEVAMDPVQLVRIVSNLVLNSCSALARSAESEDRTVSLEMENAPTLGWIILRVRDTGSGMPTSVRLDLARPDLPIKPPIGSGRLGLASVRRMVRRAGGRIEVESDTGRGTDISIRFPCAQSTASRRKKSRVSKSNDRATASLQ